MKIVHCACQSQDLNRDVATALAHTELETIAILEFLLDSHPTLIFFELRTCTKKIHKFRRIKMAKLFFRQRVH